MSFNFKLWSVSKHRHALVQFLVAALFVGLAFRLVFFGSSGFGPDFEATLIDPEPDSGSPAIVSEIEDLVAVGDRVLGPIGSEPVDSDRVAAAPIGSGPVDSDRVAKAPVGGEPVDSDRVEAAPIGGEPADSDRVATAPVGGEPVDLDRVATAPIGGGDGGGENRTGIEEKKCNLFAGDWVPDPSGPLYTNETCPLIEGHQNCMRNGRPDTGYLYWRWNPKNCELPRFDPRRFLHFMRNKTWGLIGDSISRNHVQSMLCMLSTVEQAIEIYHDEAWKSKKWLFPSHNFTVSVIWSPFLVQASIFEDDNGVSSAEAELHFDKLDPSWTDQYRNLDYIIISSGKWFAKNAIYHENNTILGCHNCANRNLTNLGFDFAYRKALRSALTFIATERHEGLTFFRTSTPDHFESGEWSNGGNCPRTAPAKEGEIGIKDMHHYLRDVELSEFERASRMAARNGIDLRLLDLLDLSLMRPDGHPGPYRYFQPFAGGGNATTVQNDCLHWCLPGPIDAWNDVIMEMVIGN